MTDQGISHVLLPTDRGDKESRAEKNEDTNYENAESSAIDLSGNQAQPPNTSDHATTPTPRPPNPDEEAQEHQTTEPDGYYPQTLDVSGDMARCLHLVH